MTIPTGLAAVIKNQSSHLPVQFQHQTSGVPLTDF